MLDHYYYLASLPALGELGSEPSMGFAELLEHLEENRARHPLVGSLFLLDDLLQREAFLAGELEDVDPAVFSIQQVRNESPLPEFLASVPNIQRESPARHRRPAVGGLFPSRGRPGPTAGEPLSGRLGRLRGGAAQRLGRGAGQRLGLDETDYVVAADLASASDEVTEAVTAWASAATPLSRTASPAVRPLGLVDGARRLVYLQ